MKPVHKHFIVRAEVKNPPKENDERRLVNWMRYLIQDIDMKLLFGPIARYVDVEGNEGLTAIAMIETSHIAMHIWEKEDPPLLQLDVYTCGPFKPGTVLKALQEFNPITIHWKYLDRETDLKTVDIGIWHEDSPWPDNNTLRNG
jgi:S-adenosylmethionine/arginine decarboxylase-like enzyme